MNVFRMVELKDGDGFSLGWHRRGSRPERPADVQTLKDLGVKVVMNLRPDGAVDDNLREQSWVFAEKLSYVDIPFSAALPPSVEHLQAAVRGLAGNRDAGQSVFVHCLDGVDRTGAVVAAYRVKVQGWPLDAALGEMVTMGFHKIRYSWWMPFLRSRIPLVEIPTYPGSGDG